MITLPNLGVFLVQPFNFSFLFVCSVAICTRSHHEVGEFFAAVGFVAYCVHCRYNKVQPWRRSEVLVSQVTEYDRNLFEIQKPPDKVKPVFVTVFYSYTEYSKPDVPPEV